MVGHRLQGHGVGAPPATHVGGRATGETREEASEDEIPKFARTLSPPKSPFSPSGKHITPTEHGHEIVVMCRRVIVEATS